MKKMFLTVALFVATFGVMSAENKKNDEANEQKIENVSRVEDNKIVSKRIVSFYDVDKIVISNKKNTLIKIYDDNWNLIKETNESLDLQLVPGNYYVESETNIVSKFVSNY